MSKEEKTKIFGEFKKTHDWLQEGVIDRVRGVYQPMVGCCKKCGIHYQLFKVSPKKCPANSQP